MTDEQFRNSMRTYIVSINMFKNKSNNAIRNMFTYRFSKILHRGEALKVIEIHPTIKYLFDDVKIFGYDFDQLNVPCPDFFSGIIGTLWGAEVREVKHLPYLARFIGANGTIVTFGKRGKQVKKVLKKIDPYARFKNLEI